MRRPFRESVDPFGSAAPPALLTGSLAFGGLLIWWLVQLAQLHAGLSGIPTTDLPPTLLHGPAMIYLGLAPFIFGFLLTVFPRWIGLPDLALRQLPLSVSCFLLVLCSSLSPWHWA
ncbi:NnrS family protein [Sphingopyxis sp.]|uniref:NnrS family protein n=1 Tax=Sphingopyxis sp. TaxID=1908224 RepID=UPI0025E33AD8|nr:NnrS family protein [Sphingopyxis sp.]MBK6412193.1 NnrS family protein [Sphingopyxis sp.]